MKVKAGIPVEDEKIIVKTQNLNSREKANKKVKNFIEAEIKNNKQAEKHANIAKKNYLKNKLKK